MRSMISALPGLTLTTSAAQSHATLERASPPAGSTVAEPPKEVVLTFSDRLEPAFSRMSVMDANGMEVSEGDAQVDGDAMRIRLKVLEPGSYKVNWRAVSADSHAYPRKLWL